MLPVKNNIRLEFLLFNYIGLLNRFFLFDYDKRRDRKERENAR